MFKLIPTTKIVIAYKAKNSVTNKYWNGEGFVTPLYNRAETLDEIKAIALKYTYQNVILEKFEYQEPI